MFLQKKINRKLNDIVGVAIDTHFVISRELDIFRKEAIEDRDMLSKVTAEAYSRGYRDALINLQKTLDPSMR